jgi:hypothetical protein
MVGHRWELAKAYRQDKDEIQQQYIDRMGGGS